MTTSEALHNCSNGGSVKGHVLGYFQYNGNPAVVDSEGRNAFYYAHCSFHFDCADFLARNGCPRQAVPAPALAHYSMMHQQQHHQQHAKSSLPPSQAQPQAVSSMTPKHHHQQQQHPGYKFQQPQGGVGYRGSAVAANPGIQPPMPQGVMPGVFAPGKYA